MTNQPQGCGHHAAAASPTDVLKAEHRVIERVLDAAETMIDQPEIDRDFFEKAMDFFRNFADGCHHAKEEDLLFPGLNAPASPAWAARSVACWTSTSRVGR